MMKKNDMNEPDLAAIARHLAIPDRAPDEAFVARVRMEMRARALMTEAKKDGREQLFVELLGGAALIIGFQQWASIGDTFDLLPSEGGAGGMILLSLFVTLLLASLAATDMFGGGRQLTRPQA